MILGAFGLLSLVMGAFIIYNTFRTLVAERRHDLGMLRTLGATRRAVLGMTLAEGLVQGLAGTAVGLAMGYAMTVGVMAWVSHLIRASYRWRWGGPCRPSPVSHWRSCWA